MRTASSTAARLPTAFVTCGRKASESAIDTGAKKRRRSTSATSSFWTGWTPSSFCRLKTSAISALIVLPVSSLFSRSEASSDATSAQRSTFVTAWHRYWKKSTSRPRHASSTATLPRANISTSSISTSVASPSAWGRDSRSTSSGSAGGVSRSSSRPSACNPRTPAGPAIWKASTLHGCFSQRSSPPGPRTSIPFSTSSLSNASAATRAGGSAAPTSDRNCSTAGSSGSDSGSCARCRSATSVCVFPPPYVSSSCRTAFVFRPARRSTTSRASSRNANVG